MKMNKVEIKHAYKNALKNCTWGELKLLLKIKENENSLEILILKQLIKEKRKNETI